MPPSPRVSSSPRSELERSAWPELEPETLAHLRSHGTRRPLREGDVLFEVGQPGYDFFLIEEGSVHIVDRSNDHVVVRVERGAFLGDIGMLMGQGTFLAGVAAEDGVALVVPQDTLRELARTLPEVGDVVVSAFSARRRLLIEWNEGGLVLVGSMGDPTALRLLEFAGRSQLPHRWVDRSDREAVRQLSEMCDLPESGAAAVLGNARVLTAPCPRELAEAMGLDLVADTDTVFDVLIVGAGPAGLSAAVYASSEGLRTLVVEDTAIGGQAGTSSRIENYLGFPRGISGKELAFLAQTQAIKFGTRITAPRRAVSLRAAGDEGFLVTLDDGCVVRSRSVVLANGVQYRRLALDRLEELEGRGVYYAATDLEARFCRGTEAVVVGGGNSAGQAAMFLSRYASRVHVVVRGAGLSESMSAYLSNRLVSNERIRIWTRTQLRGLSGEDRLDGVTVVDTASGTESRIATRALFVMVGAAPNTDWLGGQVALDPKGFVLTGRDADAEGGPFSTSLPGVFAVGDLRSGSLKRVASAVGEGSMVVSDLHRYMAARSVGAARGTP